MRFSSAMFTDEAATRVCITESEVEGGEDAVEGEEAAGSSRCLCAPLNGGGAARDRRGAGRGGREEGPECMRRYRCC